MQVRIRPRESSTARRCGLRSSRFARPPVPPTVYRMRCRGLRWCTRRTHRAPGSCLAASTLAAASRASASILVSDVLQLSSASCACLRLGCSYESASKRRGCRVGHLQGRPASNSSKRQEILHHRLWFWHLEVANPNFGGVGARRRPLSRVRVAQHRSRGFPLTVRANLPCCARHKGGTRCCLACLSRAECPNSISPPFGSLLIGRPQR